MGRRMGVAAALLAASALLSRVLGFAREVIISAQHGASAVTDAYYAAFTLPELMSYFLAGGTLSITFIPLFSSYVSRGDEAGGWRLFSRVATLMGTLLVVFTVLGMWAAPWLTRALAPGFEDPAQRALVTSMTRIVLPAQLAFYLGGLIQATLFVREVFWTAALSPLVYNACIILGGVLLGPWLGVEGFAVGVLLGSLLGPLGLPLWAARRHIVYTPSLSLRDPGMRRFFALTLPLMLGATLVTMDELVLRVLGSRHPEGAISWLTQSRKLMMVLFAVIGQAAGQAALPFLTRLFHEGKTHEMGALLSQSVQRLLFVSMVAAGGLMAVAQPLVFATFHRGQFTAHDAAQTGQLLVIFALGLGAWSVQSFAVRGFYARQDTLTPMLFGTVVLALMAPVYWLMDQALGVAGLAWCTTIGISLNAWVTLVVYQRKYGGLAPGVMWGGLWRGSVVAALCSATAWGGVWGVERAWTAPGQAAWVNPWQSALALVVAALCAAAALGAVALVWRPDELSTLLTRVRGRLGRLGRRPSA